MRAYCWNSEKTSNRSAAHDGRTILTSLMMGTDNSSKMEGGQLGWCYNIWVEFSRTSH